MTLTISLITLTREDMEDIGHRLTAASIEVFPKEGNQKLLLSLRGSFQSGKSIIAETIRDNIWGARETCSRGGKPEYDEYWVKEINGKLTEFDYIDVALGYRYSNVELNEVFNYEQRELAFLNLRHHPGITVIQNKKDDHNTDIAIWVEKPEPDIVWLNDVGRAYRDLHNDKKLIRHFKSDLSDAFDAAASINYEWARFIDLGFDEKLIKRSEDFKKIVDDLSAKAESVKKDLEAYWRNEGDKEATVQRLMARKYNMGAR